MTQYQNIKLFNPSGCLSIDALTGLHSNSLNKRSLQKVNDHLKECDLCQDAFEGFKLVNNPVKINEIVTEINYNLKSKLIGHEIESNKPNKQIRIIAFSAAASIIILFGLFFLITQTQKSSFIETANNIPAIENLPTIPIPDTSTNQKTESSNPSEKDEEVLFPAGIDEKEMDVAFLSDTYESQEFYLEAIVLSTVPAMNLQAANQAGDIETVIDNKETLNIEMEEEKENIELRAEQIFSIVEQMPEFPQGYEELSKYLKSNLQYPQEAREMKISGKVFISFIVEENGNITNAKILRGIGGGCDEAALEIIEAMPDWNPGKQNGKAVKVQFNMPIVFKLN